MLIALLFLRVVVQPSWPLSLDRYSSVEKRRYEKMRIIFHRLSRFNYARNTLSLAAFESGNDFSRWRMMPPCH